MSTVSSVADSSQAALITQLKQSTTQGGAKGQHVHGHHRQAPSAEMRAQFEARFDSAAKEAGIDPNQFKEIRSQIDAKMKDAMQSGQRPTRDQMGSIVNDVLKQNNIDPDDFKAKMKAVFEKMGAAPEGQMTPPDGAAPQDGDEISGMMAHMPFGSLIDAQA